MCAGKIYKADNGWSLYPVGAPGQGRLLICFHKLSSEAHKESLMIKQSVCSSLFLIKDFFKIWIKEKNKFCATGSK